MSFKVRANFGFAVASIFLILVSVIYVIFFSGWYEDFSSYAAFDTERRTGEMNNYIRYGSVISGKLYLQSGGNLSVERFEIFSLTNLSSPVCSSKNFSRYERLVLFEGSNGIPLDGCSLEIGRKYLLEIDSDLASAKINFIYR